MKTRVQHTVELIVTPPQGVVVLPGSHLGDGAVHVFATEETEESARNKIRLFVNALVNEARDV